MMKKSMENLLLGAGAAIVGFLAYAILKKPEKTMIRLKIVAYNETPPSARTSAQEYVEHRRELLRKKAVAKAAAKGEAAASTPDKTIAAAEEPAAKDVDSINHVPEDHSEHTTEADEE